MRENPKQQIALSMAPNGVIRRTAAGLLSGPVESYRACSDAVATEIVPATEAAFTDFVRRHGGRPLYPSLAAYPAPRRPDE